MSKHGFPPRAVDDDFCCLTGVVEPKGLSSLRRARPGTVSTKCRLLCGPKPSITVFSPVVKPVVGQFGKLTRYHYQRVAIRSRIAGLWADVHRAAMNWRIRAPHYSSSRYTLLISSDSL